MRKNVSPAVRLATTGALYSLGFSESAGSFTATATPITPVSFLWPRCCTTAGIDRRRAKRPMGHRAPSRKHANKMRVWNLTHRGAR